MRKLDAPVTEKLQHGIINFNQMVAPENFETQQGYSVLTGAKTMSVFLLFQKYFTSYQRSPPVGSKVKEYWVKPNPYLSQTYSTVTGVQHGVSPAELSALFRTIVPTLTINDSISLKRQLETYIK
jgi:hypothetical protein